MSFNIQTLTPKQLFLTDCLGALVSTIMLGVVLVRLEPLIGMPEADLLPLAAVAAIFFISSFLGYLGKIKPWQTHLRATAIANTLYCLVTASLLVLQRDQLTIWGILYFVGEIAIIMTFAVLEWNAAKK